MKPDSHSSYKKNTDEIVNEVKPWARFLARKIDDAIYTLPVFLMSLIVGIAVGLQELDPFIESAIFLGTILIALFIAFCLWFIFETVFISFFGTTPGKWILEFKFVIKTGVSSPLAMPLNEPLVFYFLDLAYASPSLDSSLMAWPTVASLNITIPNGTK